MYLPFTPNIMREEHRRGVTASGQGYSYSESNSFHLEDIAGQLAPQAIPQSLIPCRPSRMPIAIMQTNPLQWGSGIMDRFLADPQDIHPEPAMSNAAAGMPRQLSVRAQNSLGGRSNIARPPAVTYGSLFELAPGTYDIVGG